MKNLNKGVDNISPFLYSQDMNNTETIEHRIYCDTLSKLFDGLVQKSGALKTAERVEKFAHARFDRMCRESNTTGKRLKETSQAWTVANSDTAYALNAYQLALVAYQNHAKTRDPITGELLISE